MSIHARINLQASALALCSLLLLPGCTESNSQMPALVNPTDFAGSEQPVPLPQLEGLSEEQAREWAESSGFEIVITDDEDSTDELTPSTRVVLKVNLLGNVESAAAG